MKVIKQGDVTPWWVGKQGTCWKCHAVIQFERDDPVDWHKATEQRDNDVVRLPCPTLECGEKIAVTPGGW